MLHRDSGRGQYYICMDNMCGQSYIWTKSVANVIVAMHCYTLESLIPRSPW